MPRVDFRPLNVIHRVCIMTLALVTLALVGPSASWGQASRHRLYLRAPEVLPGVLPAMRDTAYWVNRMKQPDKRLLTLTEIERMNARFRDKMSHLDALDGATARRIRRQLADWPGLVATMPDLNASPPAELSAVVRDVIEQQIQCLRRRPFGNRLGIGYSARELDAIQAELALDAVNPEKERATGILVRTARLRIIPAIRPEYVGLTEAGKTRWDLWNLDVLPIGSAVQVLHRSRSGGFLFVLSPRGFGWVKSEDVALGSKAMISRFTEAKPFVVTTGDRVPFYSSSDCKYVSGWLRMGDRLPRAGDDDRRINVPVRRTSGEFAVEQAWLAPDADVHAGYLPYTSRNVLVQAFKLLDNIYDWTGGWFGRNHATVLRDVFATFGFDLPSNGVLLSLYGNKIEVLPVALDRRAKAARIAAHEPFITIETSNSGHSQLYLGQQDGQVFVFDTNGYGYRNEKGETLEVRRCVVGTIDLPNYMLKQDLILTELR